MAMHWECFVLFFYLKQHVAPLCLQWLLAHLFPAAWAVSMASLSLLDVYAKIKQN
jgi:hypothetical protein